MTIAERAEINDLVNSGRVAEAVGRFNLWLRERPAERDLLYRKAGLVSKFGARDLKLPVSEAYAAAFPAHAGGPFLVGCAMIELGDVEHGLHELDRSEAMGMAASDLQKYREWAEELKSHLALSQLRAKSMSAPPDQVTPALQTVRNLAAQGRLFEAREYWAKLLREYPSDPNVDRAWALFQIDYIRNKKIKAGETYAAKWPEASDADLIRARAYFLVGKYREALAAVDRAETSWGITEWSDAARMRILSKLNKPFIRTPRDHESYGLITLTRIMAQVEAEPPTTEGQLGLVSSGLADLGNDLVETTLFVSRWYAARREFRKAAQVIEKALESRPDDIALLISLARAENSARIRQAAIRRLEHAKERIPTSGSISKELARLQLRSFRPLAAARAMLSYGLAAAKTTRPT